MNFDPALFTTFAVPGAKDIYLTISRRQQVSRHQLFEKNNKSSKENVDKALKALLDADLIDVVNASFEEYDCFFLSANGLMVQRLFK